MNGHIRRKTTRELVTRRTLCVQCIQIGINFVPNFVHFLGSDSANFMKLLSLLCDGYIINLLDYVNWFRL